MKSWEICKSSHSSGSCTVKTAPLSGSERTDNRTFKLNFFYYNKNHASSIFTYISIHYIANQLKKVCDYQKFV